MKSKHFYYAVEYHQKTVDNVTIDFRCTVHRFMNETSRTRSVNAGGWPTWQPLREAHKLVQRAKDEATTGKLWPISFEI